MQEQQATRRLKYVSDAIPELQGQWVDVPNSIPLERATAWIEKDYLARIEQEHAAEITPDHEASSSEADPSELIEWESLAALHHRLEAPDTAKAADAIQPQPGQCNQPGKSQTTSKTEKACSQTDFNKQLMEQAEKFSSEAASERKRLRTDRCKPEDRQQRFRSYAEQTRKQMAEAEYEITQLHCRQS